MYAYTHISPSFFRPYSGPAFFSSKSCGLGWPLAVWGARSCGRWLARQAIQLSLARSSKGFPFLFPRTIPSALRCLLALLPQENRGESSSSSSRGLPLLQQAQPRSRACVRACVRALLQENTWLMIRTDGRTAVEYIQLPPEATLAPFALRKSISSSRVCVCRVILK